MQQSLFLKIRCFVLSQHLSSMTLRQYLTRTNGDFQGCGLERYLGTKLFPKSHVVFRDAILGTTNF